MSELAFPTADLLLWHQTRQVGEGPAVLPAQPSQHRARLPPWLRGLGQTGLLRSTWETQMELLS